MKDKILEIKLAFLMLLLGILVIAVLLRQTRDEARAWACAALGESTYVAIGTQVHDSLPRLFRLVSAIDSSCDRRAVLPEAK